MPIDYISVEQVVQVFFFFFPFSPCFEWISTLFWEWPLIRLSSISILPESRLWMFTWWLIHALPYHAFVSKLAHVFFQSSAIVHKLWWIMYELSFTKAKKKKIEKWLYCIWVFHLPFWLFDDDLRWESLTRYRQKKKKKNKKIPRFNWSFHAEHNQ